MRQFDKYLKKKLQDKDFCRSYKDNCNICPTVWAIVDKVVTSGKSWSEVSSETGLSERELLRFAEADNCQHEIVSKLCRYLEIDLPQDCPRFDFNED